MLWSENCFSDKMTLKFWRQPADEYETQRLTERINTIFLFFFIWGGAILEVPARSPFGLVASQCASRQQMSGTSSMETAFQSPRMRALPLTRFFCTSGELGFKLLDQENLNRPAGCYSMRLWWSRGFTAVFQSFGGSMQQLQKWIWVQK